MSGVVAGPAPRALTLTPALLAQHVGALRRKVDGHGAAQPGRRAFGVRSHTTYAGPPTIAVEGEPVDVAMAVSPLHVRALLADLSGSARDLVIITSLAESDLGLDVMSRFAGRRLVSLEPWTLVLEAFRARDLDPRLLEHRWIAVALLEAMPERGYEAVPAGVLDSETAWKALFTGRLGLDTAQPSLPMLLEWILEPGSVDRLRALPPQERDGIMQWLEGQLGASARVVLESAMAGRDPVALGLVCDILYEAKRGAGSEGVLRTDARDAAIRMEALTGSRLLAADAALAWARAARMVVERGSRAGRPLPSRAAVEQAGAILQQLQANGLAHYSDLLGEGFEQRCLLLAESLERLVRSPGIDAEREALRAYESLARHRMAALEPHRERIDRLAMALRLARWLHHASASLPRSVADAARTHVSSDGLADWARAVARSVDPSERVAAACSVVLDAVRQAVSTRQTHFAGLLREWIDLNSDPDVLVVERVLDERVAPLATHAPVLLLVLDGMSASTCRELAESLHEAGWGFLAREGGGTLEPVLSLLPSITTHCRTSLLSGRITEGAAADEKRNFSAHPALLSLHDQAHPPVVFHKADLADDHGALAVPVREALRSRTRVVGVVVNAVDDHLLKADQVRSRWTVSNVPLLQPILHAAREAHRLVVLMSDHGHVLDDRSVKVDGGSADRWRPVGEPVRDDEVLVHGPRVMVPGNACVLAVSEQLRYQTKKNGYHGGATPQEVVAPLLVLAAGSREIPGWDEASLPVPEWWSLDAADAAFAGQGLAAPPAPVRRGASAPPPQPSRPLLSIVDEGEAHRVPAHEGLAERLIRSEVYAGQKVQHARTSVPDERMKAVVSYLLARGGRATRAALATALGLPKPRLDGQLTAIRGLLNVEGYAVLVIDEAGDTVTLNREYLVSQFELG